LRPADPAYRDATGASPAPFFSTLSRSPGAYIPVQGKSHPIQKPPIPVPGTRGLLPRYHPSWIVTRLSPSGHNGGQPDKSTGLRAFRLSPSGCLSIILTLEAVSSPDSPSLARRYDLLFPGIGCLLLSIILAPLYTISPLVSTRSQRPTRPAHRYLSPSLITGPFAPPL
jgi:hypothetical protein